MQYYSISQKSLLKPDAVQTMNLMQAGDIENQTVSQVHLLNLLHILPGKSNIVNRNVFPNPVSMYRLGNGHDLIL